MRTMFFWPPTTARAHILFAALFGGLALLAAAPAVAQQPSEAEARSVFAAGEVAFSAGHYADALGYFQRAHTLSQRPALLFNIALCQDRLRNDEAAIEAYDRYLAEVPLAANRREVDGRLEALRVARARRAAAAQLVAPAHVAAATVGESDGHAATTTQAPTPTEAPSEGTAFYATWWFWTVVGVVVVGAGVGIGLAASGDAPLQAGDLGGTIFTLGSAL